MKYYGFNTACFSGGQLAGILLGGIFATYVGWKFLFIVPVFSLLSIPFILKYLPEDSKEEKTKIDFLGIFMMALLSLFSSLYFNVMDLRLLLASAVTAILFLTYISKNENAFITIDFFKNWKYMLVILIVFITYSTQGSYSFLFSFMASNVYGIEPSKISMILLPSYAVSMAIGIMGSKITQKIGVTKTLVIALGSMVAGVVYSNILLLFLCVVVISFITVNKVKGGDLIVATGAVRMEGTSKEYAPIEFPAVANYQIVNALAEAAEEKGVNYHVGVVECKDSFYGQHEPENMPVSYELLGKWKAWMDMGCLGSEMESAVLFTVANYLGVRCGTILLVVGNQERAKAGLSNEGYYDTTTEMQVAIRAIEKLIEKEEKKEE